MRGAVLALNVLFALTTINGQEPITDRSPGPTFDVVSVKRNTNERLTSNFNQRPDGALTITNLPVGVVISYAYPPAIPADTANLPSWAMTERYDISATSSVASPFPGDRMAMLRAMLADRFKLAVHWEDREHPAYDLVLARKDGRLGPNMTALPAHVDCDVEIAARVNGPRPPPRAPGELPDFKAPPPPCTTRGLDRTMRDRAGDGMGRLGDSLEGESTMGTFARTLRPLTGRFVVDRTGLRGSYRLKINYDRMAALRPADAPPSDDAAPSIFTALPEQLGLKLEPSRAMRQTLLIDRIERPTEN